MKCAAYTVAHLHLSGIVCTQNSKTNLISGNTAYVIADQTICSKLDSISTNAKQPISVSFLIVTGVTDSPDINNAMVVIGFHPIGTGDKAWTLLAMGYNKASFYIGYRLSNQDTIIWHQIK